MHDGGEAPPPTLTISALSCCPGALRGRTSTSVTRRSPTTWRSPTRSAAVVLSPSTTSTPPCSAIPNGFATLLAMFAPPPSLPFTPSHPISLPEDAPHTPGLCRLMVLRVCCLMPYPLLFPLRYFQSPLSFPSSLTSRPSPAPSPSHWLLCRAVPSSSGAQPVCAPIASPLPARRTRVS